MLSRVSCLREYLLGWSWLLTDLWVSYHSVEHSKDLLLVLLHKELHIHHSCIGGIKICL